MKFTEWKKLRRRFCCMALALSMIMCNLPTSVYALEDGENVITEAENPNQDPIDDTDAVKMNGDDADESADVGKSTESDETDASSEPEEPDETEDDEAEDIEAEDIETEDIEESISENDAELPEAEEEAEASLDALDNGGTYKNYVEWKIELNDNNSSRTLIIKPVAGQSDVKIPASKEYPWTTYKVSVSKVVIGNGIINIPNRCFYDFQKVTEVDLADSIEEIGESAFYNCSLIQELDLPENLRIINRNAFEDCRGYSEIILPSHTEQIKKFAFKGNSGLTHIKIPASVSEIAENFYENSNYSKNRNELVIDVDSSNRNYSVKDGILYEDATGTVLLCGQIGPRDHLGSASVTLRPGTKRIGEKAFADMNLTRTFMRVYMPDSVTQIGNSAFFNSNLTEIVFSQNLKSIDHRAFAYCEYLPNVQFPDSVTELGTELFYHACIYTAYFPKSVTEIPDDMYKSTKLSKVFIPSGIEVIGQNAFAASRSQYGIEVVCIPKSVREIKDRAFAGNTIKDVYYGGTAEEWRALLEKQVDIAWLDSAEVHYYTDCVDLEFQDGILQPGKKLKAGITFGEIGLKNHASVKQVIFSDWVNKYGTSMSSTDTVAESNEYFAYVSIVTDSFFNEATKVTLNGDECEIFDIAANGKRLSFVTPVYDSECRHSRVNFSVYESNGEKHWHDCPDCGSRVRENAHNFDAGTSVGGVTTYKCTVCNYEKVTENGRMRMNKTQINGGYYEVGSAVPTNFTMDESYAYSSCYELSDLKWYKGAYSSSHEIDAKRGLYFEKDTYFVEFSIAIKEDLVDQYYLKSGGINIRFVKSGLTEETSYRMVTNDPNNEKRQIQKVVFSYAPIDRSDLTVVLPPLSGKITASKLLSDIRFTSAGQNIEPAIPPSLSYKSGGVVSATTEIVSNTPYIISAIIDVPGYVDEKSVKGSGIVGCGSDSIFNYRKAENKTGCVPVRIEICYNPKGIVVANIDVEAPIAGEKLGEAAVAREFDLFEVKKVIWTNENGDILSPDDIVQVGREYHAAVHVAPKGQNIFTQGTIFTVNGYDPSAVHFGENGVRVVSYRFPAVEAHVHIPTLIPTDPGNCSRTGHVAYYQCSVCGRNYLDKNLTERITDINAWLTTENNGLYGGMIQDASIHNFAPGQEDDSSADHCADCGIKNINYRDLKVHVYDVQYTGSMIDAPISIEGLAPGSDYYISDGAAATLPGVYKAVIKGLNSYGGQRVVEWVITTDGMWLSFDANNAEYEYTGTQIKPSVKVYDGTKRLTQGKDYTIAYKNNVNAYTLRAGDIGFAENKAPTVTVSGKGDYSGKETAFFVINRKSLSGITVDDMYVNTTGKPIAVKPVVKVGKKTLKLNKDYKVFSTVNPDEIVEKVTSENIYRLEVRGIGNYKDATEFDFNVSGKKLISKCSITVKNAEYDEGRIVKPDVSVKYQGKLLELGKDYDIELSGREVGSAVVKIRGKGDYIGVVVKNFQITGLPISSAKADSIRDYEYNGSSIVANLTLTYTKKGSAPVVLKRDVDYDLEYSDNVNVGKAKITVTGKGRYTGSKIVRFNIVPYDVEKSWNKIIVNDNQPISELYLADGVKPEVPVTYDSKTLTKDVDYTCTYSNHTKVASESDPNAPKITFRFKGNFKGKIEQPFSIEKMPMDNAGMEVYVSDVVYSARPDGWMSKPVVKDENGKMLKEERDYKVSYYRESSLTMPVDNHVNVVDNIIYVKVEGMGSYTSYTSAFYHIRLGDISTASATVKDLEYDPEGVTRVQKSDITINCNGYDLGSSDYYITEIQMPEKNKPGTGTVVLRGQNQYFGTKRVNFRVVPRKTLTGAENKVIVVTDSSSVCYRKNGAKMGIKVWYTGNGVVNLKEGTDYTLSYANIKKAALRSDTKAPTITVKFKGNYTGKQEIKYDIIKQPLSYGSVYNSDVIYNSKPDGWKQSKFTFKDEDKNVLKAGKDYEVLPGYYLNPSCTMPFSDMNNIVGVSVYVKLAAIPSGNYEGNWIGSYKIVRGDISKAKVTVKNTKNWTGSAIYLTYYDIDVKLPGITDSLVGGRDWEIVSCYNNIDRGTATVEVRGTGDFSGTKTATFKIVQKPFRWWNR